MRSRFRSTERLRWRRDGQGWALHLGRQTKPLATVRPDAAYAGMFRVHREGAISDMVNLSRAKEAAIVLAMETYNRGRELH